jgi:hypothetical protein
MLQKIASYLHGTNYKLSFLCSLATVDIQYGMHTVKLFSFQVDNKHMKVPKANHGGKIFFGHRKKKGIICKSYIDDRSS